MKTIDIDDDLYDYLLKNTERLGETATEIIRRLIRNPSAINNRPSASQQRATQVSSNGAANDESEIRQFLESPRFRSQRQVVDRFLSVLVWLHGREGNRFSAVLGIAGRSRKYFALSEKELNDSGTHINPKQIPGTSYWVVTNNDTPKKQDVIRDVMQALGYSSAAIQRALDALR
jgi:negative modulator of initiation of replication